MELDDLKNDWESVTNEISEQSALNSKAVTEVIQTKYHSKIQKIRTPEIIGGIICILGIIFIGFNFNKLDTIFSQSTGVLSIILLLIIPLLSFLSLTQFKGKDNFERPYVEILKQFANQKLRFLKYQKLNAFLSALLLVTVIILLPKLFYDTAIAPNKYFWIFSFPIGYLFLLYFSKWVNKYYGNSLRQAEELLQEVEA